MSHENFSDWVAFGIMFALLVGILGPLFWSLHTSKIPLSVAPDGWITTRRSIFDHIIGIIQIGFAVVWILFGAVALFFLDDLSNVGAVFIFILMLAMGFLFLQSFLFVYCANIRFNENYIEYRAVWRNIRSNWNEVEIIKMGMNGPEIVTAFGSFSISNVRRGFYQLLEMATKNGVRIQDSPYLKQPGTSKTFGKRNR